MTLVEFSTLPPYGTVHVNPDEIFAAVTDEQTPADDTLLLAGFNQAIHVLEAIGGVGAKLGGDFRGFMAASQVERPVLINRVRVLHVLPHPQVAHVSQVHGLGRRIAVQGDLADVVAALS